MNILKKHPALFLGLVITFLFLAIGWFRMDFLDTLELKFYDLRMKLMSVPEMESEIVLVDIDDDSIEKLGRWPWPRSLLASGIDKISAGEPKVIGLNIILSEPEENSGLKEIETIRKRFDEVFKTKSRDKRLKALLEEIDAAAVRLNNDKKLATAIQNSGKVSLPLFLKESSVKVKGATPEKILADQSIPNVRNPDDLGSPNAGEVLPPIPEFMDPALGIGHINLTFDIDGTVRRERPFYEYRGIYIPSYNLRLASLYRNIAMNNIRVNMGESIQLGGKSIPLTFNSEILIGFKGPRGSFKRYSFFDVINDKIPLSVFKNKLVLVTPSASGIFNPLSTAVDATMPVGEFSANTIWALLHQSFVAQPPWGSLVELVIILVIGLTISFVFPRLRAVFSGFTFIALLLVLLGGATYFFISKGLWVQVTVPVLQLILGYIGIVSINYFVTETGKEKVEGESAETNRMLGISFQSQGMLDMAFDKLRRVPVDDEMKDILYNLALDYERKRQLNKAAAVYEYIEDHDNKFKDVSNKKTKLMQASETMVFGDGFLGGGGSGDDLLSTGTDTKPTLGRYEIIKQLGKGAMGIVYLGKDPRINRTTAIKTFRFAEEYDSEDVEKMKEKFFREAESAGTLSHPNIVTIYDAGDEHDLAYIAMEFLEGEDLERYTKKENLLPVMKVIEYVGDIADALNYAHKRGIVHRDIKPANIMLIKSGVVKITDFGIARITATSQTQTGVVKGTPYYMSPEQFSGEKVDGRSDIFSLGTMMFQLLTGVLPFSGDSPAALMNQIMNVKHPDPRTINPKLWKPLVSILDRSLEKDRGKRYQEASQMAAHMKELGKRLNAAIAQKKAAGKPADKKT